MHPASLYSNSSQELVAVAVASLVAVSTLKRRREFDEKLALSAALAERLENERNQAREVLANTEQRLLDSAPDVVAAIDAQKGWASSAAAARTDALREGIRQAFQVASTPADSQLEDGRDERAGSKSPRLI